MPRKPFNKQSMMRLRAAEASSTFPKERVSLLFYNGHTRSNYFDLEVSVDGIHDDPVLTGMSSKKQSAWETFEFPPIPAKFIQYVGQGNEINTWNSLIEIWVHAQ